MNLKNKPPIFVPTAFQDEIEKLSKAALMDIAWDYAQQIAQSEGETTVEGTMIHLRRKVEIVLNYRNRK